TALGVSQDAYQNASDPGAVKAALEGGLAEISALMKPVFYQDNLHTFFVEPEVTERTIEEWQGRGGGSPQAGPSWGLPTPGANRAGRFPTGGRTWWSCRKSREYRCRIR